MGSEIGVRLAGDNSHFRAVMADSVERAGKFGGEIAGKVSGKLFELRDVSNTIAAALGINLRDISENLARTFIGFSKAEEEALKQLEVLSGQVADANIRNARALLTEEQRYQLAIQERDRLLREIADNQGRNAVELVAQKNAELKLAERTAEIAEFERKQIDAKTKQVNELIQIQIAGNEKVAQTQLASMAIDDRIVAVRENIVAIQTILNAGVLDEKNTKLVTVQLAERQNMLAADEAKQQAAREERARKDADRRYNAQKRLGELKYEELSTDEKIGIAQTNIATLTNAIAEAKNKGIPTAEYEVMLAEERRDLTSLTLTLERQRPDAIDESTSAVLRQAKAYAELTERVQKFQTIGTPYEGQSTAALEGVRDRVRAQLTQAQQGRFGKIGGVGQIGGLGPSVEEYGLQSQLVALEKELAQRRNVGSFANQFGEDAARQQFGDTLTDRALRDLQDTSQRTSIAIQDIQQRLALVFKK